MAKETTPENTGTKQGDDKRNPDGTFKPGVSGNPAGKPVGAKHLSTKLLAALEEIAEMADNPKKLTYSDLLTKRIIKDAIEKGNSSFVHLIYNYIDGMPQQGLDLTTGGDKIDLGGDVMAIATRVSEELKKQKVNGKN